MQDTLFFQTSCPHNRRCDLRVAMPLVAPSGAKPWPASLGGANRATPPQPASLLPAVLRLLPHDAALGAFLYNPARYPAFVAGVREACAGEQRGRVCLMSGTHRRELHAIEARVHEALERAGTDSLDCFFAEYVCPQEADEDVRGALLAARRDRRVRAVGATTHSVSAASRLLDLHEAHAEGGPLLDALMLRVSLAHDTHEAHGTLDRARELRVPVVAFCCTRWNGLLEKPLVGESADARPTAAECAGWALSSPGVEMLVHSSRDLEEAEHVLLGADAAAHAMRVDGGEERERWRAYGARWRAAHGAEDGFDADAD